MNVLRSGTRSKFSDCVGGQISLNRESVTDEMASHNGLTCTYFLLISHNWFVSLFKKNYQLINHVSEVIVVRKLCSDVCN